MQRFLFDTDVLIDAAREVDEAIDLLVHQEREGQLAVSTITQMELIVSVVETKTNCEISIRSWNVSTCWHPVGRRPDKQQR